MSYTYEVILVKPVNSKIPVSLLQRKNVHARADGVDPIAGLHPVAQRGREIERERERERRVSWLCREWEVNIEVI
jgi:hypothetical protein